LPSPSGNTNWLVVKFPIWDSQLLIGAVAIDISRQIAAEERERRTSEAFRLMVSAVNEYAIFMLDSSGRIQSWNEGAQRLKGYAAEEIIGKHFSIFYPPEEVAANHPAEELELATKNGSYHEENWRVRKDGSRFWADVTITAVFEKGELQGFAKVTRDKTDQRNKEQELAVTRDQALEASALKSAFVATISHEIRTPLSGILGMNELLLQTDLNDEQRDLARTVQASSQSLLTILNDVLDLSRIEAGKLHLEPIPFNVSFTSQDATRLMSAAAKSKGLMLTHQIDARLPELVIGDPERLRQILLNLIGNAVKFTHKGEITVEAKMIDEDADTLTIKFIVKDTGIGIGQDERKHLFAPFGQVESTLNRKFGGSGLGLTISKHLVNKMGGQIGFESEKGKGSTFWFSIPFPKTAEGAPDLLWRRGENINTEPIALIVEDNAIMQDLATKQLTNLGIKSLVACCGSEAVEAIHATQFDAIFMDCHLPKMDGYEATKAIRQIEKARNRRTPIIAMTAAAMASDREKALASGMDDYITKLVSLENLRAVCEKWIPRSSRKIA
jgi:osomolarity two-component system, sensor histidine kinase TcsA